MVIIIDAILNLLRNLFNSRLGASLLGLVAFCSLIGFAVPSMGLSDGSLRLCIISTCIFIFIVVIFIKWLWIRSRGMRLQQQLLKQQEAQAGRRLEIELLKEKMNAAVSLLKTSDLGVRYRGQAALYALPWFMLIGPSAAGKSTLLRNSGLHFSFRKQEDLFVNGFGGTRNCDWWFTDEAILLDTAGRYTTEDEDHQEWLAFLDLLKKYRPRIPINGIIVAMSMVDLLTLDQEGLQWHVRVIRDRIAELYQHLGYIFPVYLVLTKSDLIHGFNAFYADLNETERAQLWGINLLDEKLKLLNTESIEQKLQSMYARLTQLRLDKLGMERNRKRKSEIYEFPEQFALTIPRLIEFIQQLSKPNPYQELPNFCGIYFTSGTQEGMPIQRLLGNLRQTFGYINSVEKNVGHNNEAQKTKSYFIENLFNQVIFPNQHFSAKTKQRLRVQRLIQSAAVMTAASLIVISIVFYSSSYTRNTWVLHQGQRVATDLVNSYSSPKRVLNQTLPALLNAFDYYQSILSAVPWYWRLGVYRAHAEQSLFEDMFFTVMQREFLPSVIQALQNQLLWDANNWDNMNATQREQLRGQYYSTLQAYLMLAFPKRLDADQISGLLATTWNQQLNNQVMGNSNSIFGGAQQYENIIKLYLNLLQKKAILQDQTIRLIPPSDLIARCRQQLYTPTDVGNLYAQLENAGVAALAPTTINQLIMGEGADTFTSPVTIPGMYTAAGWHNFVEKKLQQTIRVASQGDWVIDTPLIDLSNDHLNSTLINNNQNQQQQLLQALRSRYFAAYTAVWMKFLQSVQLTPATSLNEANSEFAIFTEVNSPILQLLQQTAINFDLHDADHQEISELRNINQSLKQLLGDSIKQKHKLTPSLQAYLTQLQAVQNELQQFSVSPNQNRDCQNYAAQLLSGSGGNSALYKSTLVISNALSSIDNVALRRALQSLMLAPVKQCWRLILTQAAASLDQLWQAQVYQPYQENIATKFPFANASNSEVALSDLSNFLQPKTGILWNFVNTFLAPYLVQTGTNWHVQQWLGIGLNFSPTFLQEIAQANSLASALFKGTNNQLTLNLEVYPEPTPGLSQIILVVDGQDYHYRNGPQQWQTLTWPGTDQNQSSELTAIAATGMSPNTLQAQGVWGLFHLLKQAQLKSQAGSVYRATWELNGGNQNYSIHLLLRSDNNSELLQQLLGGGLVLPNSLFLAPNNLTTTTLQ